MTRWAVAVADSAPPAAAVVAEREVAGLDGFGHLGYLAEGMGCETAGFYGEIVGPASGCVSAVPRCIGSRCRQADVCPARSRNSLALDSAMADLSVCHIGSCLFMSAVNATASNPSIFRTSGTVPLRLRRLGPGESLGASDVSGGRRGCVWRADAG